VRNFRHAIALDERRAKFKANTWNRPVHGEHLLSITDQKAAKRAKKAEKAKAKTEKKDDKKKDDNHKEHLHQFEHQYSTIRDKPTDVEEVGSKHLVLTFLRL
jgi:sRNA-binding protein